MIIGSSDPWGRVESQKNEKFNKLSQEHVSKKFLHILNHYIKGPEGAPMKA